MRTDAAEVTAMKQILPWLTKPADRLGIPFMETAFLLFRGAVCLFDFYIKNIFARYHHGQKSCHSHGQ